MAREEIIIDVSPIGEPPRITVTGVKGTGCKALTKPLEQMLGSVIADKPTSEMQEAPLKAKAQQRERTGGL